jgi:hypothetical protein
VEEYGLDELAASAESVLAGLGPLAAGLARLAGEAGRAVTLDAMEVLVLERGRELLRELVQLSLDAQAEREVRQPQVTGRDGVTRTRAERGHDRPVVTRLGEVRVQRIAYRAGIKGAGSLFPRDAVLNLPPLGYSWSLQQLAEMFCRAVSYEQAHEFVLAATGVAIGKRLLLTQNGSTRTGSKIREARPGPGRTRRSACRRWRSPPMARGWRCARRRAAAGPGPRNRRCGPLRNEPGPGRRRAASGWPRPAACSTSPSRTARRAPPGRSCARIRGASRPRGRTR